METYFGVDKKDWFPVSLGFNCHAKMFIVSLFGIDTRMTPRLPFDYIGTSMKTVHRLTASHFEGFLDPAKFVIRPVYFNKDTRFLCDSENNVVFAHDFKDIDSISPVLLTKVQADYQRRITRFYELLANVGTPLLFFRIEKDLANRILYKGDCAEEEFESLIQFSQMLRNEFRRENFFILNFTQRRASSFDAENRILHLFFVKESDDTVISAEHLGRTLREQKEFVLECLREPPFFTS